ncbi:MAG: hypothetical protein WDM79_02725 [Terricaulis sp.]
MTTKPPATKSNERPNPNGFLFFIAFAVAIAVVCLGVVIFAAQLPG